MGMSPHSSSTYIVGMIRTVKRKNGNTNQGNTFGDYTDDKGNIDVNTEDEKILLKLLDCLLWYIMQSKRYSVDYNCP